MRIRTVAPYGFKKRGANSLPQKSKRLRRALATLVVVSFAFLWSAWQTHAYPAHRPLPSEVGVVLGASTWKNEPSPVYRERIRHAVQLYHDGVVRRLFFTGCPTFPGEQSCGEVGARAAIKAGVPENAVEYEGRSRVTRENLLEVRDMLETCGSCGAVIITDPLHMRRAMAMAEALGIQASPSGTPTSALEHPGIRTRFLLREAYFWWQFQLVERFLPHSNPD